MRKKSFQFTISLALLVMSSNVFAGGLLADVLKEVGIINAQTAKSLDEAHRKIKDGIPVYKNLEESASSAVRMQFADDLKAAKKDQIEIKNAVAVAEKQLQLANGKLEEARKLSEAIEKEKQDLELQTMRLEEEKASLKQRSERLAEQKELLGMGFYASSLAAAIGFIGLFVQWPLSRKDLQLKDLEILKLQRELAQIDPSMIPKFYPVPSQDAKNNSEATKVIKVDQKPEEVSEN